MSIYYRRTLAYTYMRHYRVALLCFLDNKHTNHTIKCATSKSLVKELLPLHRPFSVNWVNGQNKLNVKF